MARNIVFLVLDTVRKDVFDAVATRTQARADMSIDTCRAASSWSAPSHASLISGDLAHEHGVHTHDRSFNSLPAESTVFDDLREYHTIGVSANVFAGPAFDFDQYFDEFFVTTRGVRFPEALNPYTFDGSTSDLAGYARACLGDDHSIKALLNGAGEFVDTATDALVRVVDGGASTALNLTQQKIDATNTPTFAFVNLMEAHTPYRPAWYLDSDLYDCPRRWSSAKKDVWELFREEYDETYWERRNGLYRATVDYLDRQVAAFVDALDDKTTVIVTADHGDNLGTDVDEGLANHKSSLSEGLLHVPLCLLNAPEVASQTGPYWSHLSMPELIRGVRNGFVQDLSRDCAHAELVGLSAGPDPPERYEYYDRAMRCTYRDGEKVVWDSLEECRRYELVPGRANHQRHVGDIDSPPLWATERFGEPIRAFKQRVVSGEGQVSVDQATADRLEELGYL